MPEFPFILREIEPVLLAEVQMNDVPNSRRQLCCDVQGCGGERYWRVARNRAPLIVLFVTSTVLLAALFIHRKHGQASLFARNTVLWLFSGREDDRGLCSSRSSFSVFQR